jgi:hypothetical protein
MKEMQTVLANTKIYDFMQLDKNRVLIITMQNGVRVLIVDLKRRAQYELKWWADTQRVKLLPWFNYKGRPLVLTVKFDTIYLRNLQNHTIVGKLRDGLSMFDGAFEPLC